MEFEAFFERAVGEPPYAYQQVIAREGLPDLIEVPTGAGKTAAVVLPWAWRRLEAYEPTRALTPRRLVLVLPTRALTRQTARVVARWLERLDLESDVDVYDLIGGDLDQQRLQDWRINLHRPAIIVATVDMVVSRTLMRGYGSTRAMSPIDSALMTNDAHIVVDEVQLASQGVVTLRQLNAFQRESETAAPVGLTVMSATVDHRILDTVDNRFSPDDDGRRVVRIHSEDLGDDSGPTSLGRRVGARRTVLQLDAHTPTQVAKAAVAAFEEHGHLVLVIANTVGSAQAIYRGLSALPPERKLLLHSRFRGAERGAQFDKLAALSEPGNPTFGGVVVATQAIEAGVDIDSRTLITEVAPWPSVIQRVGRCNRRGDFTDATVYWVPTLTSLKVSPYRERAHEVDAAREALLSLEGREVDAPLLNKISDQMPIPGLALRTLRRRDLDQLFDTGPDLSGNDIDIRPFIHTEDDLDIQVAWVEERPDLEASVIHDLPSPGQRCPVSISALRALLAREGTSAWRFDLGKGAWTLVSKNGTIRPQDAVLLTASSGGYDSEIGFDPKSTTPLALPAIRGSQELAPLQAADDVNNDDSAAGSKDVDDVGKWISLDQHGRDTEQQALGLLRVIDPAGLNPDIRVSVRRAALLHDLGKAHPSWQAAICCSHPTEPDNAVCPVAKSPGRARLNVLASDGKTRMVGFRHEVVSALLLGTSAGSGLLTKLGVHETRHSLVRYLVGSHHGHLRVSPRDQRGDGRNGRSLFGLTEPVTIPRLAVEGHELPATSVDPGQLTGSNGQGWTTDVAQILESLGPFRLAYLEALVRMADWRASRGLEVPGGSE